MIKKVVLLIIFLMVFIPVFSMTEGDLQSFLSEYGIAGANVSIDDANKIIYIDKKLGNNEYEITQNVVYILGVLSKQNNFANYEIILYGSSELYFKSGILDALRNSKTNSEKLKVINAYLEKVYYPEEAKQQKLW